MSDSLRTPNYNDFSVYKDNLLPPAAYFVPFSTAQDALESDPVTARYSSDRVTCLSGDWRFRYYEKKRSAGRFGRNSGGDGHRVCALHLAAHRL